MLEYLQALEKIGTKTSYKDGDILFYEGDTPNRLYILLNGILHLYKSDKNGGKITIHFLKPVNFVAEMALFKNIPYPASAVFQGNGEILSVPFNRFKQSLQEDSNLSLTLIASLCEKIRILNNRINQNMLLHLKGRLIYYILDNHLILKNLNQREIAQELNVTPQSLSRILRDLKSQKLIDVQRGKIIPLDEVKLKNIAMLEYLN